MNFGRRAWWLVVGVVVAVVLPAAALHSLTIEERLPAGLTAAPFGWPRLLVAHLAAAVPLGFVLAGWMNDRPRNRRPAERIYGWLAAALVVTGFAVVGMSSLANILDGVGADLIARVLVRSAVSTALVTPWVGVALALANSAGRASRLQAAAALLVATLPPGVYAARLVDVRSASMDTFASTGRIVRARAMLSGLNDIVGSPSLVARRRKLDHDIDAATKGVAKELSPKASASARLTRAFVFIQLDRTADAEAILAPLSKSDSTAALLLGAVYRDQRRWADAERTYRRVLEVLLPNTDQDLKEEECATAYEGLAESLRGLKRSVESSEIYREALMRLPGKRAYFHFQLGLQEANLGRSAMALGHFAEAVRLDPKLELQTAAHARRLRVETPICLTYRSGSTETTP